MLSGIALLLALGDALPLYRLHHMVLPSFRIPTRLLLFWSLGITILGAIGLDVALKFKPFQPRRLKQILPWIPAFTATLAALTTAVFVLPYGGPVATTDTFLGTPLWLAGFGLIVLSATGLFAHSPTRLILSPLVLAFIVSEGIVFTGRAVTQNSPQSIGTTAALEQHKSGRVMTFCEGALSVTDLLLAGIPSAAGAGPLHLAAYDRFSSLASDAPFGQARMLSERPRADLLDLLHVTHVLTCEPMEEPNFNFAGRIGSTWAYENLDVKPRAWLTCPTDPLPAGIVTTRLFENVYDPLGWLVPRPPPVHVTWTESLSDEQRRSTETRYGLTNSRYVEGSRWTYDLVNQTPNNVFALLADESVVETNRIHADGQIDRRADPGMDTDPAFATAPATILVGGERCDVRGTVVVEEAGRPDGVMRLLTETPTGGLVFLSEPYYPEREASLDGLPVPIERANLAFSAVAVPPGRHVIELRYVPLAFYWGIFLTALTAAAWLWMIRM